jgi:hypothetical protein
MQYSTQFSVLFLYLQTCICADGVTGQWLGIDRILSQTSDLRSPLEEIHQFSCLSIHTKQRSERMQSKASAMYPLSGALYIVRGRQQRLPCVCRAFTEHCCCRCRRPQSLPPSPSELRHRQCDAVTHGVKSQSRDHCSSDLDTQQNDYYQSLH